MKTHTMIIILVAHTILTGCGIPYSSIESSGKNNPLQIHTISISEKAGEDINLATVISIDANKRTMIIKPDRRFCAEPPPDAAFEINNQLKTALAASVKNAAEVDADFFREYGSEVVSLASRTELLEVYRAGVYAICQYHLNGALKDDELVEVFQNFTTKITDALVIGQKAKLVSPPASQQQLSEPSNP